MATFSRDHLRKVAEQILAFADDQPERWRDRRHISEKFPEWTLGDINKDYDLIEDICIFTAIEYHSKNINYDDADTIVNELRNYISEYEIVRITPPIFWKVYDAFDAGEWHRAPDRSDDPVAERTDPAIAEIVASL